MSLPNRIRIAGVTGGGSDGNGYYTKIVEGTMQYYNQENGTWQLIFLDEWKLFDGTDFVEAAVVSGGTADVIPTTPEWNAGLKTEDGYGGAVLIRPEPMVPVKLQVSGDTTPDVAGVYPQTIIEPDVFCFLAEEPDILLIGIYWDFEKGQYVLLYFKDLGDEEIDEFYFLGPDNYYSPLGNYVADGETGAVGTAVVSKFISQGGLSAAAYQYLMDVE